MVRKFVSVEDFISIFNLMGTYHWLVDEDAEGNEWASLFTEDCFFSGIPPKTFYGHEGLKKIAAAVGTFQGKYRHLSGNYSIEYGATKDEAYARYYTLTTTWLKEQGPKLDDLALAKVHLVRINGEWKIKSNTIKLLKE